MIHNLQPVKQTQIVFADVQEIPEHGYGYRLTKSAGTCEQDCFLESFCKIQMQHLCFVHIIGMIFPQFAKGVD